MLGSLEVTDGELRLTPTRPKERTLLALLLAHAGRPVPTAEIHHALWGGHPPASARANVYSYVAELRRTLNDRLVRTPGGYVLHVADDEVDASTFERLVTAGRRALREGRPAVAVRELEAALRLWRGDPLTDIQSPELHREVARLVELRLVAVEDLAEANLATGHAEEVATALPAIVAEHPLRERPWALLMRAWHRTGRQGEALGAYQRVYRLLTDELGIEPGAELKRVHQEVLGAGPACVPRQLPAAAGVFLGRDKELAELDQLGAVVVLTGFAGVGKSTLALRWAHSMADEFPDGQLYVDLRGHTADRPLSTAEAQARLLASFGVDQVPADPTALFRSVLAGRRVLVVLDNAASAEQVRPLLPGSASCRTLVTSRDTMTGLVAGEGADRLTVAPLSLHAATEVLVRVTGLPDGQLAELARLCGCVPLALRVAAANLVDDPTDYIAELTRDGVFARLTIDGDPTLDVAAAIGHSYDRLSPGARTVLHLLTNTEPLTVAEVAARLGSPPATMRPLLGELAAGSLAERTAGRFTVPDLLRQYVQARTPRRRLVTVPAM